MHSTSSFDGNSLAALHENILLVQRRMRWLRMHTPFYVDPEASNLLPIIASRSPLYAKDLAAYLLTSQAQVSRLLKRLLHLGYLAIKPAAFDARFKEIAFTDYGKSVLEEVVELDNCFVQVGIGALNGDEREKLRRYVAALADGLGAPEERSLPNEDPWVTQQKRFARISGMLGSDYMQTGCSISSYQLLFELNRVESARFRELKKTLPLEPTFLVRQLQAFTTRGLCRRLPVEKDKRGVTIAITQAGKLQFKQHEAAIRAMLGKALPSLAYAQIDEFSALMRRCVNQPLVTATPAVSFLRCTSDDDYFLARRFLIERLQRRQGHHRLGAVIIPKDSLCFLSFRDRDPAVLAAFRRKDGGAELEQLECDESIASKNASTFLQRALVEAFRIYACDEICIPSAIHARARAIFAGVRLVKNRSDVAALRSGTTSAGVARRTARRR